MLENVRDIVPSKTRFLIDDDLIIDDARGISRQRRTPQNITTLADCMREVLHGHFVQLDSAV